MAVSQPTKYVDWALFNEISVSGNANKVNIPEEFKNSGLKEGEPLPRAYFNEQMNLIGNWVRYLEDQINTLAISAGTSIIQQIYPVGSYWIGETTTNPNTFLGFGTWELVEGKFLVGRSTTDTDFDGVGEEGGFKTHSHTNSLSVSNAGEHNHEVPTVGYGATQSGGALPEPTTSGNLITGSGNIEVNEELESLGQANSQPSTSSDGSHTHNITGTIDTASNLPPYRTVSIYRRTA